ncbi:MAG: alpha/beta hydrolase [Candidatus Daviesbacteria bacterium]|nr:alpha/beta hydrolase [Candidatus Daviesbacteria bacterium]
MKETIVLLPGWTKREPSYKELINTTPEGYEVLIARHYNLAPHGQINNLKENFLKFLDAKKLEKITLVGHSLGGALGIELAITCSDHVNKLFLIGSAGIYGQETISQLLMNQILNFSIKKRFKSIDNLRNIPQFTRHLRTHIKLGLYAFKADLKEQAQQIKVPTTILWGEKDVINPLWQGEKLQELISHSKLVVLEDMDHDWILHSPEKFWENIK